MYRVLWIISVNIVYVVDVVEWVLNIIGDVVGDILFVYRIVGRDESDG